MRSLRFGKYSLAAALLLLVGGCGFQQVQPTTPTAVPTVPIPTAVPAPTYTILPATGNVAAVVNGTPIPMSRFKDFFHSSLLQQQAQAQQQPGTTISPSVTARQTMQQLVEAVILQQQAAKRGDSVPAHQITAALNQEIKSAGSAAKFQTELKKAGLTEGDVKIIIIYGKLQTSLPSKVIPLMKSGPIAEGRHILITASEPSSSMTVQGLFNSPSAPATKDKCEGKVLTDSEALAEVNKFIRELHHGASFAKLARKCSDDPGSAAAGGALTSASSTTGKTSPKLYPYAEGYVTPFENALFQGPVSNLQRIHSEFGWHIVQVTSRHNGAYSHAIGLEIQSAAFQAWITREALASHTTIIAHLK